MKTKKIMKMKKEKQIEERKKNVLILQSKGGAGKSYFTQLLALYAQSRNRKTHFIDADNSSASTTKYFEKIKDRKGNLLLYKNVNLLSSDNRIDRSKLDYLMEDLSRHAPCVVDFGAASSDQMMHWMKDNDYVEMIKELDVAIFLIMAGGNSILECVEFYNEMAKIPKLKESGMVNVVANEFYGGIEGKQVKEYAHAKFQIPALTEDQNSSLFLDWKNMLSEGIVLQDLEKLTLFRRKTVHDYLEKIFVQLDPLFYDGK